MVLRGRGRNWPRDGEHKVVGNGLGFSLGFSLKVRDFRGNLFIKALLYRTNNIIYIDEWNIIK